MRDAKHEVRQQGVWGQLLVLVLHLGRSLKVIAWPESSPPPPLCLTTHLAKPGARDHHETGDTWKGGRGVIRLLIV